MNSVGRRMLGEQMGEKGRLRNGDNGGGVLWIKLAVVLLVGLFLSRAFFVQVVTGQSQLGQAEGNSLERKWIEAKRGVVKDRTGEVMVRNSKNDKGEIEREYLLKEAGAHLLGYVGEVGEGEMEEFNLRAGEWIGKMGVESAFDESLRGTPGQSLVEVDADGEIIREVTRRSPMDGRELKLNVSKGLQEHIATVLKKREEEEEGETKGAVVVTTVDGELLGLVSWPSFDANLFVRKDKKVKELLESEDKPLFNRAALGIYPPGSVYKLVTATAGLEEGVIDENTLIEDTGEIVIGQYRYGNWYFDQYGKREGELDVTEALKRSNDIFFYKTGERLGVEKMREWSHKMGLGEKIDWDLGGQITGGVPDPIDWEKRTGQRWFLGNTYHMSIGQGDLRTSPLQINRMTATAVSGEICDVRVEGKSGKCSEVGIDDQSRELVVEGMKQTCSEGGTAYPFFDFEPQAACKTGTSQQGGEEALPHAWISVVVPKKGEEEFDLKAYEKGAVITVLLEAAGEGSEQAGPVAREIADYLIENVEW